MKKFLITFLKATFWFSMVILLILGIAIVSHWLSIVSPILTTGILLAWLFGLCFYLSYKGVI